jgi:DhnA family fructose-bisphosphate aldolase class Ia
MLHTGTQFSQDTLVCGTQGNMQGILAMLQSKADRHAAALAKFQAAKQEAELCHNSAAAAAAADSKAKLAAISSGIEQDLVVLAEDRVMVLTEQQLQEVSCTVRWCMESRMCIMLWLLARHKHECRCQQVAEYTSHGCVGVKFE